MLTNQLTEFPGVQIEDSDVNGWEVGDIGWAVDQPTMVLPDGTRIPVRITWVVRREDGAWRCVHAHTSVGIPDEALMSLLSAGCP